MKTSTPFALLKGFLFVAAATLVIAGCKKSTTEDSDTTAANENAFAESSYNETGNIADQAGSGSVSLRLAPGNDNAFLLSGCCTVQYDTVNHSNPDTILIHFGAAPSYSANCWCLDGRQRRGTIMVTYTKPHYRDSLDVITITFPGNTYFVDNYQIMGTKTITNLGRISGNPTYNVVVSGTIVKPSSGGSFSWNANRTRTQTAGQNTPFIWNDDIYSFTGSASGNSSDGNHYTAQIIQPVIMNMSCPHPRWFTQGILNFTPDSKPTRVIDFGTGACDNLITVTINGHPYTVYMW
jgi:hypothetical protein